MMQTMPKTPAEYRQGMQARQGGLGHKSVSFEVARPYQETAQFMKKKANECLKAKVRYSDNYSGYANVSYSQYEPFANIGPDKAEIYLTVTGLSKSADYPSWFVFLADVKPLSKNRTQVELYHIWGEPSVRIGTAVRAWANGEDVGCPGFAR